MSRGVAGFNEFEVAFVARVGRLARIVCLVEVCFVEGHVLYPEDGKFSHGVIEEERVVWTGVQRREIAPEGYALRYRGVDVMGPLGGKLVS